MIILQILIAVAGLVLLFAFVGGMIKLKMAGLNGVELLMLVVMGLGAGVLLVLGFTGQLVL
ncbi:hypothetical protein BpsS36_00045 [Bacillus phage vB_BpsS-36]|uniref:Uncharacterized protein n=1 Tax=Bacillus phage vB_BpsS-36 TaxID=2419622 RepID=A0A3G3BXT7_9CAUD|nr:hypothetical protein BpsS36_00045 [Bacillus phage vB_BpsS-36]